jgi:hypothetical protein
MVSRPRVLALVAAGWLALPAAASADWFITPFIGGKFAGTTNVVDLDEGARNAKFALGVSTTILSDEIFGIEAELGYFPRFFERSSGTLVARSNVLTVMGNVIAAVPRRVTRDSLRPYAIGGVGLLHLGINDLAGLFPVSSNLLGLTLGGGAIGHLTSRTSLRIEVRHFRNISREEKDVVGFGPTRLTFWRATVGVSLLENLF